jgi:hypothetical protein
MTARTSAGLITAFGVPDVFDSTALPIAVTDHQQPRERTQPPSVDGAAATPRAADAVAPKQLIVITSPEESVACGPDGECF